MRPAEDFERKSVGTERTFRDQENADKLREILRHLADELEADLDRVQTAVLSTIRDTLTSGTVYSD